MRAPLPPFTEEHEELRETVRRFVGKEIAPHVDEWEEACEFPRELYTSLAEAGLLAPHPPRRTAAPAAAIRRTPPSRSPRRSRD